MGDTCFSTRPTATVPREDDHTQGDDRELIEANRYTRLKAAGSYFQRTMCHTVLAGLILDICEGI